MRAVWRWALLGLLACGCKDEGAERYQQALGKYQQCVDQGLRADDPRFAEVLKLLDGIAESSSAHPRAASLRRALEAAQRPKIRTPLAIQGGANLPEAVAAQLAHCRTLAEALGKGPEEERPARLRELDACRAAAERLDAEHDQPDAGR